ncbi:MAG: thymidine kinase [Candidatus Marinimicrobia bacterium]|nr:thymidine kinase [Candidatus Neomarinimicrobiota bacterium]
MGIEEVVAITGKPSGWIEVVCGSMFSGKTEELIRRLRRAQIAKQKVAIFKPMIDVRYSEDHIVSHNQQKIPSIAVEKAEDILKYVKDAHVLGIDEAQFFDASLVMVCRQLAESGRRVIVAGLDKDYRGIPFEPIPQLLCEAEYITKTLAICMKCGNPASYTQRITKSNERVLLGATDSYEARCRSCFEAPEE